MVVFRVDGLAAAVGTQDGHGQKGELRARMKQAGGLHRQHNQASGGQRVVRHPLPGEQLRQADGDDEDRRPDDWRFAPR